MSKKQIIIEPDPILRKKSFDLEKVDDELRKLMDDMLETMYAAPGIGLAAVQIGILKRLIVIDISKEENKKNPLFLVNPKIKYKSENTSTYEEGCLSLPGHFAEIERPAECQVKFIDYNGKKNSTIGSEKSNNPRLQVSSKEEYAEIMDNLNLANPKMMDIAVPANLKGLTLKEL